MAIREVFVEEGEYMFLTCIRIENDKLFLSSNIYEYDYRNFLKRQKERRDQVHSGGVVNRYEGAVAGWLGVVDASIINLKRWMSDESNFFWLSQSYHLEAGKSYIWDSFLEVGSFHWLIEKGEADRSLIPHKVSLIKCEKPWCGKNLDINFIEKEVILCNSNSECVKSFQDFEEIELNKLLKNDPE